MNLLILIKFIAISSLVYGVFRLALDETSHYLSKRTLFLLAPIIMFIASVVTFDIGYSAIPVNMTELVDVGIASGENASITFIDTLSIVYLLGFIVAFTFKLVGIIRLNTLFKNSVQVKQIGDIKIYENDGNYNLSFFDKIIVHKELNQIEKLQVIEHELIHIEKRHSVDMIIYSLYSVFFWFNPFVHLMQRELKLTHEFDVDSELVSSDLEIMSPSTKSIIYASIANNYSFNNLKRRFRMKKNSNSKLMPLYVAIATTVFVAMFTVLSTNITQAEETKEVTVQPTYKGDLMAELGSEVKYPKSAKDAGAEGKALVKVIINTDGSVHSQSIESSSGNEALDKEAIRAVSTLKEWNPGEVDGEKVKVVTMIPIMFRLPKEK